MTVMSNRETSVTSPGVRTFSNAVNSGSYLTTPKEAAYYYFGDISTTDGSKPDRKKFNLQTFSKLTVNTSFGYNNDGGILYGKPYENTLQDFGRIDRYLLPDPYVRQVLCDVPWDSLKGRALEKVLNKARGAHGNLAVDVAEGRSTLAMLRKSLRFRKLVAEFARDVIKHRGYKKIRPGPSQGQRRLDYVNGKWLEYRYGWGPLVQSIYDLADALRKEHVSSPVRLNGRAGWQGEQQWVVGSSNSTESPLRVITATCSVRYELGCDFALPSGLTFADFTSLNPLGIAWELVPFSFVFDWFLGIGQCLENWENYFLYRDRFISGYETWTQKEDRTFKLIGSYSSPIQYNDYGFPYDRTYWANRWEFSAISLRKKRRTVLFSLPTPSAPRLKLRLGSKQMLDSAALIGQYVKKFRH